MLEKLSTAHCIPWPLSTTSAVQSIPTMESDEEYDDWYTDSDTEGNSRPFVAPASASNPPPYVASDTTAYPPSARTPQTRQRDTEPTFSPSVDLVDPPHQEAMELSPWRIFCSPLVRDPSGDPWFGGGLTEGLPHDILTHVFPTEIVENIFLIAVGFDPGEWTRYAASPGALSLVCRRWRDIALRFGRLWDCVALNVPLTDVKAMKGGLGIGEWVRRSAGVGLNRKGGGNADMSEESVPSEPRLIPPIDIYIRYKVTSPILFGRERNLNPGVGKTFAILLHQSCVQRWRYVHIALPRNWFRKFGFDTAFAPSIEMPHLRKMELGVTRDDSRNPSDGDPLQVQAQEQDVEALVDFKTPGEPHEVLKRFPGFRELSLSACRFSDVALPWVGLTSVSIFHTSILDAQLVLEACKRLKTARFVNLTTGGTSNTPGGNQQIISGVQALSVEDVLPTLLPIIFRRLALPRLKKVRLALRTKDLGPPDLYLLSSMVSRSGCEVEELDVEAPMDGGYLADLIEILESLPTLRVLRMKDIISCGTRSGWSRDVSPLISPFSTRTIAKVHHAGLRHRTSLVKINNQGLAPVFWEMFSNTDHFLPLLEEFVYEGTLLGLVAVDYMEGLVRRTGLREGALHMKPGQSGISIPLDGLNLESKVLLRKVEIIADQEDSQGFRMFSIAEYQDVGYVWDLFRLVDWGVFRLVNSSGEVWL